MKKNGNVSGKMKIAGKNQQQQRSMAATGNMLL